MRRAAVSISSDIAEGSRRRSKKEFVHFLTLAFSSGAELETQIIIAKKLSFGKKFNYTNIDKLLEECMKMLNKMLYGN